MGWDAYPVRVVSPGRIIKREIEARDWTQRDLDDYTQRNRVPPHPLVRDGYLSIGCMACTSKVAEGEDPRAGRWRGREKTECGIHVDTFSDGGGI